MNDFVRTAHVLDVFYPAGLARADYLDALTKAAELLRRLESAAPVPALVPISEEAEPASAPEPEPVAVIAPPAPVPAPPKKTEKPYRPESPPTRYDRAVAAFAALPSRIVPAYVVAEVVGVDSGTASNAARTAGWSPAVKVGKSQADTPSARWGTAVLALGRDALLAWFDRHHTGRVPSRRNEIIAVADGLRDERAQPAPEKPPKRPPVPPPRPFAVERDEAKEAERERIAKGLEEFRARGGQVKRVVLPGSPEIGREVAVSERGVA